MGVTRQTKNQTENNQRSESAQNILSVAAGFLGEFRELVVIGAADTFWDANQPLHWRQVREISGMNILGQDLESDFPLIL